MMNLAEYPLDFQNRIANAAMRLFENDTEIRSVNIDYINYEPVVIAFDDYGDMRFGFIRIEDARDRVFENFADVTADEINYYTQCIKDYFEVYNFDRMVHLDIVDFAIMADDQAVTRVFRNATADDNFDMPVDFENQMFATVKERMDTGQEIKEGSILDVNGEVYFAGCFTTNID